MTNLQLYERFLKGTPIKELSDQTGSSIQSIRNKLLREASKVRNDVRDKLQWEDYKKIDACRKIISYRDSKVVELWKKALTIYKEGKNHVPRVEDN